MAADFSRIGRAYRWMEYFSFGPLLERCRFCRLPELGDRRRALVIGDGDGRFLARWMRENPVLRAEAVDASPGMLRLLEKRVAAAGAGDRLTVRCEDARQFAPAGTYDSAATHFFLDCLTTEEVAELAAGVRRHLAPGAVWVVSDFAVPGGMAGLPARLLVSYLYAVFGILTGLTVRRLPMHARALEAAGFSLCDRKIWLGGLLFSEVWRLVEAPGTAETRHSAFAVSHLSR